MCKLKSAFAITKYIYPIEETELFAPLGYTFDNPRTDDEVKIIIEFLNRSLQVRNDDHNKSNSWNSLGIVDQLGEFMDHVHKTDAGSYADGFYQDKSRKKDSIIELLAKSWIIVRYEDKEGLFEQINKDSNNIFKVGWGKFNTEVQKNYHQLLCLSHILSLLAHNQPGHYYGETFLLTESSFDPFYSVDRFVLNNVLEDYKGNCHMYRVDDGRKSWLFWLNGKDALIGASDRLQEIYSIDPVQEKNKKVRPSQKQSVKQKINHIGNHLRMTYQHRLDPELQIVLLVGIIEFLLTRNPDTNRFNVEDSISKQFNLKCAIAIANEIETPNMNEINEKLKNLYSLRSDVAHGNYIGEIGVDKFVNATYLLCDYLQNIIDTYIERKELIDYLKDN
ncbi:MAG: hypothetical protein JKY52_10740 [Flavobacteriales bacterium]|nr:hypothetical protein [Flavobacteriales bacterium]